MGDPGGFFKSRVVVIGEVEGGFFMFKKKRVKMRTPGRHVSAWGRGAAAM